MRDDERLSDLEGRAATHYITTWLDIANRRLVDRGLGEISAGGLICGCIAWGDVPFRLKDMDVGQLTELGIAEFSVARSANNV